MKGEIGIKFSFEMACFLNAGACRLSISPSKRGSNRLVTIATAASPMTDAKGSSPASEDFIRPHLKKLAAYTPIEPFEIISAKLNRKPQDIVKLDANENPYGPPPEVFAALGSMDFPNIYPDPETRRLRQVLAELNNTPAENILVGCGADELIDLLMRCVLDSGDAIVDCPPTFTMYVFDAAVNDARVLKVPRLDRFKLDIPAIRAVIEKDKPKMVFLTSPNNPDGGMITETELLDILALPVLVVLDEAYIEFSQEETRMNWVTKHQNLVVLRTFSKSAALAGLRVGYGAFPSGMIQYLWRAKQPYNVSVAAEVAALAALSNKDYMTFVRNALVNERERLFTELQAKIPYLQPFPSHANFLLCRVTDGRDARGLKDALAMQYGIMIRHYATKELNGYVRISVGKPEQTDKLLAALAALA